MGVPGLFAFIRRNFPKVSAEKRKNDKIERENETCDNLYIGRPSLSPAQTRVRVADMNHILHSCAHTLGLPPVEGGALSGFFPHIAAYVDLLVETAKPQKLCLLAVDGVAPRAKLMQQRTRRFLGAYRRELSVQFGAATRSRIENESGKRLVETTHFDSNIITPGTPFMAELTELLRDYVDARLTDYDAWKGLKVVLSTAKEPGEGEHKIMSFIRDQRQRPGYDPTTSHVIFGQDADLILLSLLTHEPRIRIVREEMPGHGEPPTGRLPDLNEVDIGCLRRCLKYGLDPFRPNREELPTDVDSEETSESPETPERGFDFERTLEDFVLLTFLLGNDFLPSIPSIDIYDRRGGLELVVRSYKEVRRRRGGDGFLTRDGEVDKDALYEVLTLIADDEIHAYRRIRNHRGFKKNRSGGSDRLQEAQPRRGSNAFEREGFVSLGELGDALLEETIKSAGAQTTKTHQLRDAAEDWVDLKAMSATDLAAEYKRRTEMQIDEKIMHDSDADPTRFGDPGYEGRYYADIAVVKRGPPLTDRAEGQSRDLVGKEANREVHAMCVAYFQGICWSFAYYTVGVSPVGTTSDSLCHGRVDGEGKKRSGNRRRYASWNWLYGYHYAPLLKDLKKYVREAHVDEVYRLGAVGVAAQGFALNAGPAPPLLQLMAVLPLQSAAACLPECLAETLLATQPDSEDAFARQQPYVKRIEKYFPPDLSRKIDARWKIWPHTVVVKVPFVDFDVLSRSAEEASAATELTEAALERNQFDCAELLLRMDLCDRLKSEAEEIAALQSRERVEWGDTTVDPRRDPILDLVIPQFETLFGQDEEDEETTCMGLDIAGITSGRTPCRLLTGALDEELAEEGYQFFPKVRHSQPVDPTPFVREPGGRGRGRGRPRPA